MEITLKCKRCSHAWVRRNLTRLPFVCPRCKSPYYLKERRAMATVAIGSDSDAPPPPPRPKGPTCVNPRCHRLNLCVCNAFPRITS